MTPLLQAWKFLKSLPREAWYILAVALFLWWFAGHQFGRGYDARSAEYAEMERKAVEQARNADEAARAIVLETNTATEAGNDRAREAAKDSDDPLKAGLDALGEPK